MNVLEEYFNKFGIPPQKANGMPYSKEYENWLKKAIERGMPYDENDFGEFFKDNSFDLVEKGEDFDKGLEKGIK